MFVEFLFDLPWWDDLVPWLKVENQGHRRNIEVIVRQRPDSLTRRMLAIESKCASCGALHQPIRPRKGMGDRMVLPRHVFVTTTCPNDVNPGCNRTKAARLAHDLLIDVIEGAHRELSTNY